MLPCTSAAAAAAAINDQSLAFAERFHYCTRSLLLLTLVLSMHGHLRGVPRVGNAAAAAATAPPTLQDCDGYHNSLLLADQASGVLFTFIAAGRQAGNFFFWKKWPQLHQQLLLSQQRQH